MSTMLSLFRQGGPIMWPILVLSIVAAAVAIERAWVLTRARVVPRATVSQVLRLVAEGRVREAIEVCRHDGGPFARVAMAGLEWWDQGPEAVREAIEDAGRREAPRLMRFLGVVGTVASVSPLLGLLGTVTGMIKVFQTISLTGPGQGEALSAGIAEALLTTAFGLGVAIPALIVHNILVSRAERLVLEIEEACHAILRHAGAPAGEAEPRAVGRVPGA